MNDDDNGEYKKNADECRRMASGALNNGERRSWLKLAESWLRMLPQSKKPEPLGESFQAEVDAKDTLQKRTDRSH